MGVGVVWWVVHLLNDESSVGKIDVSSQAIAKAIALEPLYRQLVVTNGVEICEHMWQEQSPKDGWGKSLRIRILQISPLKYKVSTMTPWPEVKVIEYDSGHPEKGIYEYLF